MSTEPTDSEPPTEPTDEPHATARFPLARALPEPTDTPAWKRPDPGEAESWQQMYHDLDCDLPYFDPDEVTTS